MTHPASSSSVRLLRRPARPDSPGVPHPSWRGALGSVPSSDDQRLASASEFWLRLGI